MDQDARCTRAEQFAADIDDLASVVGDPRRHRAMSSYCTGLTELGLRYVVGVNSTSKVWRDFLALQISPDRLRQ